jgi:hypothetical protein
MSREASLPEIRYLKSGLTSMRAAPFRIAWYSISGTSWYEDAQMYPDQFLQAWLSQRADVLEWNGVPLGTPSSSRLSRAGNRVAGLNLVDARIDETKR